MRGGPSRLPFLSVARLIWMAMQRCRSHAASWIMACRMVLPMAFLVSGGVVSVWGGNGHLSGVEAKALSSLSPVGIIRVAGGWICL